MRKPVLLIIALLAAATLAPSSFAATKTVDITRLGFVPDRLTIDPGDTVTWTNKDSTQHQIVADQGAFPSSPALQANQAYSYRFVRSGTFSYRDGFARNERGRITVREGVSLAAMTRIVRFGGSTTLSGAVSNAQADEKVTVEAQECGKPTAARLGVATTVANGAWSMVVKPTLNTVYQVRWKTTASAKFEVKVAPRVALVRLRARRFSARVTATQSFVGKYVVLQRYNAARRRWLTLKRVVLRTAGAPVGGAITSRAGVTSRVPRRTRLRLVLPQPQAGTCYAAGQSATVRA
jgi:plastocyanin